MFEETEWHPGIKLLHRHCTESLQVRPKAWNLDIIISKPGEIEVSEVNTHNEKSTELHGVTLNNPKFKRQEKQTGCPSATDLKKNYKNEDNGERGELGCFLKVI